MHLSILFLISTIILLIFLLLYIREGRQRRQAQLSLTREKEFLSLAMEESNIYAWRFDDSRGVFIYDENFFESLAIPQRDFTIDEMKEFTHPEEREKALKLFYAVKSNIRNKLNFIIRADFNGKGYLWYEFRYINVKGKLGSSSSIVGLIMNIQEYKTREQELTEARDLAAKAELKQSFLDNMSHEIRTPLNAIVGFSNLLTHDNTLSQEDRIDYTETINRNSELLLKLINDILEISRIESESTNFTSSVFNLNHLIEETYKTHLFSIPANVVFKKEIPPKPIYIDTDASRLTQVLNNFISNAIKFTSSGYIILGYKTYPETEEVKVYVEDSGNGIPEKEQKMIFERFYKRDKFAQGTGLGLSISQVIIDKLGGKIEVSSVEGKGSCFTVIFPYSPEEQKKHFIEEKITLFENSKNH